MTGMTEGAKRFAVTGEVYDGFMGRYSRPLAVGFADVAEVAAGQRAIDVGCGPGALTTELVGRLGAASVTAIDPSPPFVVACAERHPGVDVREGAAERIPAPDASFDRALMQLVLHFVSDPPQVASELRRVLRPGGVAAGCVWDFDGGMEMLRAFWDAALVIDPDAPDEARTLRFGRPGEIADLLDGAGFVDVRESAIEVSSDYADFDELWSGFLAGVGPAGAYCLAQAADARDALRQELFRCLGSPTGGFTLGATARSARATAP